VALDYEADALDATALTNNTRRRVAGLFTAGFSFDAMLDPDGIGGIVNSAVGTAEVPLTISTTTAAAIGDTAYILPVLTATSTPIAGAVGDIGGINVSGFGDKLLRGVMLRNATITSTGVGTGYDYGSVPSGTAWLAVHVMSLSGGGSLQILLRSDSDSGFGAPTTTVATTNFSAPGYAWTSGSATEQYWQIRAVVTGTVTAQVACAFAIVE
jgi:hypothetical protein